MKTFSESLMELKERLKLVSLKSQKGLISRRQALEELLVIYQKAVELLESEEESTKKVN